MKVSVLIPAYNCEAYVEKAIRSILNQSYSDIEVLVSDDCSTDNTRKVIDSIEDQRLKRYHNNSNQGNVFTRNMLVSKATGDLIAIQDADDWSAPQRIGKYVELFESQPEIEACACGAFEFKNEKLVSDVRNENSRLLSVKDYDGFPFMPATLCLRLSAYKEIGGLNPYFERLYAEDHYWSYLIMERFGVYYIAEPLYYYRIIPESLTRLVSDKRKTVVKPLIDYLIKQRQATGTDDLENENLESLERIEQEMLADNSIVSEYYRSRAAIQADLNNLERAQEYMREAIRLKPFSIKNWKTKRYINRKRRKNS